MPKKPSHDEIVNYYNENAPLWDGFLKKMNFLIKELLKTKGICPQDVLCRVKGLSSFENKCNNDKYADPFNEITDMCGMRIITYTLDDIKKVSDVIEDEFEVKECIDKSEELPTEAFGYNCKHYLIKLGNKRTKLSEYAKYADLFVEVQVPTILQHAWAEIAHDLNYKSASKPPKEIQRDLFRIAAVLELADKEFCKIISNIDEYKKQVNIDIKGKKDVEINSISLMEFMKNKFDDPKIQKTFNGHDADILSELEKFGIKTISQLNKLITPKLKEALLADISISANYLGMLRMIMMATNAEKYFDNSWGGTWTGLCPGDDAFFAKFGVDVEYIQYRLKQRPS